MIRARNSWKELAVSQGYKSAEKIAKDLGKEIKKAAAEDKRAYFNKDFKECCDRSNAWKTAKVILGINDNISPTSIKIKDTSGEVQYLTNPEKLAEVFNNFFKQKVDLLRSTTNQPPVIPPVKRLEAWLKTRSSLSQFPGEGTM